MPYLHSLSSQGVLLNNMYGVSHALLTNYIAMTSGNAANAKTKADCFSYDCVYESPDDTNIGDQLEGAGYSWKGYMESMPTACAHGVEGSPEPYRVGYVTRHNPFMYYRSIVSNQACCDAHVVPLAPALANDLANNAFPQLFPHRARHLQRRARPRRQLWSRRCRRVAQHARASDLGEPAVPE